MELTILYEDTDIVAVAKPAGMLTHPDGKSKEETAEDWFRRTYHVDDPDAGYAHRLDRDTSGVLVFAKNAAAREFLQKAFHDREAKKEYLAFVYGVPKQKKGVINFAIGRSRSDFRLRSAQRGAKGQLREARTHYEVLADTGDYALLKMNPETGRMHQIRTHLKAIHHPVVNDRLYAPNHPSALGISRLGLHAYTLDIPLPSGGRTLITAPPPEDLAPAFAHFPGIRDKLASLA